MTEYQSFEFKLNDVSDNGQFQGYAATFGNVDLGNDVVEPFPGATYCPSLPNSRRNNRRLIRRPLHNAGPSIFLPLVRGGYRWGWF